MFCYKGYPHWSFRPSCDEYYEIQIKYGQTTTSTMTNHSASHTVTSSKTELLSDEYVNEYLLRNCKRDISE